MRTFVNTIILLIFSFNFSFAQVEQSSKVFYKPLIFPEPVSLQLNPGEFQITPSVTLVKPNDFSPEVEKVVTEALKNKEVTSIKTVKKLPDHLDHTYIILGLEANKFVKSALEKSNTKVIPKKEAYTLASISMGEGELITLAGFDDNGLFYAAQTFSQLVKQKSISNLIIQDYPAMPIRGTIEGFYGKPWSMQSRKSHLRFLGSVKANTYVYSPKDDPYARDQWREAYPNETLKELQKLVKISEKTMSISFMPSLLVRPFVFLIP